MDCLFCKIGTGALPASKVYESDKVVAFLDINPIRPGHTQVIPKMHYDYFDDLPSDVAAEIMDVGQKLARKMKMHLGVGRVSFCFTGGDVQHAHAHIVPLHDKHDITSARYITTKGIVFSTSHLKADADELARMQTDFSFTSQGDAK